MEVNRMNDCHLPRWHCVMNMNAKSSNMDGNMDSMQLNFGDVNTDPRFMTLIAIGTKEQVEVHIKQQHRLGAAEAGSWSKPITIGQGQVMVILKKLTRPEEQLIERGD